VYVIAIGNLTVGGTGKTSLARWVALAAARSGASPAILLGGHGAVRRTRGTYVAPDFDGYPAQELAARGGDEAAAHRAALPRSVPVAVDRDRWRAAEAARSGYGATLAVLDDGWEQGALRWNELWVLLDPERPLGNGRLLPAGPLRRPAKTLEEADVVAFLLESDRDVPQGTRDWLSSLAPEARVLRFRRVLRGISRLGRRDVEPASGVRAGLVSGVGSPERVERFARACGIEVASHAAFPDHGRLRVAEVERALREAAAAGARVALTTEKDEPRWPEGTRSPIPVRVLRTEVEPLDPVEAAVGRWRAAAGAGGAAGDDPADRRMDER
jgi:tetraacyldisaccharide 4'-kinase